MAPGAGTIEPYQPFLQAFNQMLGLASIEAPRSDDTRARENRLITNLLTLAPGLVGPMVSESALIARIEEMGQDTRSLVDMISRFRALNSPIETSTRLDQAVRFAEGRDRVHVLALELEPLAIPPLAALLSV